MTSQTMTPVQAFERDYAVARRRANTTWLLGSALFFVAFVATSWLGDFFKVTQVTMSDGSPSMA